MTAQRQRLKRGTVNVEYSVSGGWNNKWMDKYKFQYSLFDFDLNIFQNQQQNKDITIMVQITDY